MFDHKDRIELWLCSDCMYEAEGLDNDNDAEAAVARLTARGSIFIDNTDESQHECQFCGHVMKSEDVVATGEDLDEHICPKCNADGMHRRESGTDEFSWHTCDCCHSGLGAADTVTHSGPLRRKPQHEQRQLSSPCSRPRRQRQRPRHRGWSILHEEVARSPGQIDPGQGVGSDAEAGHPSRGGGCAAVRQMSPSHRTDSRGVVRVFDSGRYLAQQLKVGRDASRDLSKCYTCGRTWDDGVATGWTPVPSARCPFEYSHRRAA